MSARVTPGGEAIVNPFSNLIVTPTLDYLPDFQMLSWQEQLRELRRALSELSVDGLTEQADFYLSQTKLWSQQFEFRGRQVPLWDGLLVFPLPGKVVQKLNWGNLWEDLAKGREGQGLWGSLCEEVLFPDLSKKFLQFTNFRELQMCSDRFLPLESVSQWLQELEAQIPGDFALRPFNFGRKLAGYGVTASRWEAENLLSGIVTPSWCNGWGLFTHLQRLPKSGYLWIDNAGDQYRFEDDRKFRSVPYFGRDAAGRYFGRFSRRLSFGTRPVSDPSAHDGSPFILR